MVTEMISIIISHLYQLNFVLLFQFMFHMLHTKKCDMTSNGHDSRTV